MCLQWCHVRHLLVDNDQSCDGYCDLFDGDPRGCPECRHRDPQRLLCRLTHEPLPLARRCCHWNAEVEHGERVLDARHAAPGLLRLHFARTLADVFDHSDTSPDFLPLNGSVRVNLDELAVPAVYGIGADAWDRALGLEKPRWLMEVDK